MDRAISLGSQYVVQIASAGAIESATLQALSSDPTDADTQQDAVRQIASTLGVSSSDGAERLGALVAVPPADLAFLQTTGAKVQEAATRLQSVSEVPAEDLAYLSANGADVAKAQKDNPGQWQVWWWVCVVGQLVFIPTVFLMAGRWSPRKARQDARAHERLVARELEELARSATTERQPI